MLRTMLPSKIHRATVTRADLHHVGSVTADEERMDAADLLAGEKVAVVDVTVRVLCTASDGLSLDVAHSVASTGVDVLAVGALTHSAPVLDLGVDLQLLGGKTCS